jgi:hypothetical protein
MNKYLFVFGYEGPEDLAVNNRLGTDYESSRQLFVIAKTEADALSWGQEIAKWYVCQLYGDDTSGWKKENYATWIETHPDAYTMSMIAEDVGWVPVVKYGEYPSFLEMLFPETQ